jgi:hypothetical protein
MAEPDARIGRSSAGYDDRILIPDDIEVNSEQ